VERLKKAKKKLCRYVERHDHAIRLKAEIMVDHFHEQVIALNKIGGQARAMVVTGGIEPAILGGAQRDWLDPILDACVAVYTSQLDEDGQVDFKGKAKTFART